MILKGSQNSFNGILESWFLQHQLLGSPAISVLEHELNCETDQNIKNIIYLELFEIKHQLIDRSRKFGKKVVLVHMGDEFGKKDTSEYFNCDLILRNYYFPDLFLNPSIKDRLLWIPNGFRSGVGPRCPESTLPATHRQHLASFMGWIDNPDSFARERESFGRMLRNLRKSKRGGLNIFSSWFNRKVHFSKERRLFSKSTAMCEDLYLLSSTGFASGNNVGLYSAIMENSIFAPCPAGNSPETIRLYDALESGCIPISLDHLFLKSEQALGALGPAPFPIIASWEELPSLLSKMKLELQNNPQKILDLQKKCGVWWVNYKTHISQIISKRISEL